MSDELPAPHHLPSEKPTFAVYQLKDGIEQSSHIEDYDMVALISAPNVEQARANICCDDWHTLPECTTLVAEQKIRQSTTGDVLGIPKQDGEYHLTQLSESPDGTTELKPFAFDESPRQSLEPDSPALAEAKGIPKAPAPDTTDLDPKDPASRKPKL